MSKDRRRCRAVTGVVVGLGSDFTDHLSAHVFELILEFNFLGNRHTVLGNERPAETAFQNNVTTLRAEGNFHGICQDIDAAHHLGGGIVTEQNFLSSHLLISRNSF